MIVATNSTRCGKPENSASAGRTRFGATPIASQSASVAMALAALCEPTSFIALSAISFSPPRTIDPSISP